MKYLKSCLVFIIGGFLLFGIQAQPTAQQVDPANNAGQQPPDVAADKEKPKYAPDRVIVKFKSDGPHAVNEDTEYILESKGKFKGAVSDKSDSLDNLTKKHNVKRAKSVFIDRYGLTTADAEKKQNDIERLIKAKHQSRSWRAPKDAVIPNLSNVYVLEVPPESDIEAIVQEFQADPHVEYAQPNYIMKTNMVPNDPYYSSYGSWGQAYDDLWGLKKIQSEQAWDITQGEGVVVAVVDTGLDYNHPDITTNVWTNPGEIPDNSIDDDGNGFVDDVRGWDFGNNDNDPMDVHGHGTHVAGTIAAIGNNGIGIIGVAPRVKIMPVKGFYNTTSASDVSGCSSAGETCTSMDSLSKSIVYAAQDADIINNSWGCKYACPTNPCAEDAVRMAYGLGAVVVFSAGNNSADVSQYSPQNMTNPKPVVVSAITQDDTPAYFTNFGAYIDVAAPGGGTTNFPSIYEPYRNILSLKAGVCDVSLCPSGLMVGTYLRQAGTSMSAPHVAGLAALILSHHPDFGNEEVRQVLRTSADDTGDAGMDLYTGSGRINSTKALAVNSVLQPKITFPGNNTTFNSQDTNVIIIGNAGGEGFVRYEVSYRKDTDASTAWIPIGEAVFTPVIGGELQRLDVSALSTSPYFIRLATVDTQGRYFYDVVQSVVERQTFVPITNDSYNQNAPSISGDWIVWSHRWRDLDLHNLGTGTTQRILNGVVSDQVLGLSMDGNRIVWTDFRNKNNQASCQLETCDMDIYLYDIPTNTEQRITNNVLRQEQADISGDYIIWKDWRHDRGVSDIYLYNVRDNTERRITTSSAGLDFLSHPRISGNRIVWADMRNYTKTDIYLYDILTNSERRITSHPSAQTAPAIFGDKITWWDDRHGGWDLYLYDLATGSERRITTVSSRYYGTARIDGNYVIWNFYATNYDIYIYNMITDTVQQITANTAHQLAPDISGERIVWEDRRNGSSSGGDIYFCDLPNKLPIFNILTNKIINEGELLTFAISATDPDNDPLTYSVSDLPSGATFSGQTFSWTPNFAQSGSYSVTFNVSDGELSASETIAIMVVNVNRPPELASIGNKTVNEGQPLSFTVSATDPDGDPLTWKLGSLPDVNADGFIDWADVDRILALYGQTVDTDEERRADIYPDGIIDIGDIQGGINSLPAPYVSGLFETAAGTFSWTPGYDQAGNHNTTFRVSDGTLTASETITIAVVDVPMPDLTVSSLSTMTTAVTPGNGFTLSNTVQNQGAAAAGSFTVAFLLSKDVVYGGTDDVALAATRSVTSLAAGLNSSVSTTLTVPTTTPLGNYYVCAKADSGNKVTESDEANNGRCTTTTVQIALPDLVMTQISGPANAATGTIVSFVNTVKNQGVSSAGSFYVGFYLSTDATITTADTRVGARYLISLAAGMTSSATTTVTIPATLSAGTYYVGAVADYGNTRAETNETNNALTGNTVVLTIGADLVVSSVSVPTSATRGMSVGITNAVMDQGIGNSGSFYVGLYLSTDATITTADTRISRRYLSGLAAGATSSAKTNVTIPTVLAPGTYYIGAIADYSNTAKESNEINNARVGNTIVVQ